MRFFLHLRVHSKPSLGVASDPFSPPAPSLLLPPPLPPFLTQQVNSTVTSNLALASADVTLALVQLLSALQNSSSAPLLAPQGEVVRILSDIARAGDIAKALLNTNASATTTTAAPTPVAYLPAKPRAVVAEPASDSLAMGPLMQSLMSATESSPLLEELGLPAPASLSAPASGTVSPTHRPLAAQPTSESGESESERSLKEASLSLGSSMWAKLVNADAFAPATPIQATGGAATPRRPTPTAPQTPAPAARGFNSPRGTGLGKSVPPPPPPRPQSVGGLAGSFPPQGQMHAAAMAQQNAVAYQYALANARAAVMNAGPAGYSAAYGAAAMDPLAALMWSNAARGY